jgi:hypothetical protein
MLRILNGSDLVRFPPGHCGQPPVQIKQTCESYMTSRQDTRNSLRLPDEVTLLC